MNLRENTIGWWLVKNRIAAPEYSYPASEARYLSMREWEEDTGLRVIDEWAKFLDIDKVIT